jgi:hypothetical protein
VTIRQHRQQHTTTKNNNHNDHNKDNNNKDNNNNNDDLAKSDNSTKKFAVIFFREKNGANDLFPKPSKILGPIIFYVRTDKHVFKNVNYTFAVLLFAAKLF